MKDGPNIARVAGLIGDPARAEILTALLADRALTATELAGVAGVTKQTVSAHLAKLVDARPARGRGAGPASLLPPRRQRRRAAARVADGRRLSHRRGAPRHRAARAGAAQGARLLRPPRRRARRARLRRAWSRAAGSPIAPAASSSPTPAPTGWPRSASTRRAPRAQRRTFCRPCLDWGERRHHLGGALGAALLDRLYALRWARRAADSRVVVFTPRGEQQWRAAFAA